MIPQNESSLKPSVKYSVMFLMISMLLAFSANRLEAQSSENGEEILVVADEMPSFPGGPKALMETINKLIYYPADAMEQGIQGKVILRFAVNKEGKAILPSISKGLCPSIDKVVIDMVPKLPKFVPGKLNGQPVSVWFAVPVTFAIKN